MARPPTVPGGVVIPSAGPGAGDGRLPGGRAVRCSARDARRPTLQNPRKARGRPAIRKTHGGRWIGLGMKDTVIDTPLIGSGSQEEVDKRVHNLLDLGTSRGFLTYEE